MEALGLQLNPIQRIRQQIGKDSLAIDNFLSQGIAVCIGAGDIEPGFIYLGIDLDSQLCLGAADGEAVNFLQIDVPVEKEASGGNAADNQKGYEDCNNPANSASALTDSLPILVNNGPGFRNFFLL